MSVVLFANLFACTHTHTEVEVGINLLRGTVREGQGGARVNVSVLQGSLGGDAVSFIISTVNGSAQG
jgi:hypothetical protein